MPFPTSIPRLLIAAACCAALQGAAAGAQNSSPNRNAAWRASIEIGALWHADGAEGQEQPPYQWSQTGFSGGIGIGRFAANGMGARLSLRGFGNRETASTFIAPCPSTGCSSWQGSLAAIGVSLDLTSAISATRLPLGIETGPDVFRTLSRPHNDRLTTPPMATLGGWHTTALIGIGRHSPFELTAGANWLSGGILTWTFPVGLRFAF